SLHPMIRTIVSTPGDTDRRITRAVGLIAGHVDRYPAHVRFIARERHGGVQPVREAIRDQPARFAEALAEALAADPVSEGWGRAAGARAGRPAGLPPPAVDRHRTPALAGRAGDRLRRPAGPAARGGTRRRRPGRSGPSRPSPCAVRGPAAQPSRTRASWRDWA